MMIIYLKLKEKEDSSNKHNKFQNFLSLFESLFQLKSWPTSWGINNK